MAAFIMPHFALQKKCSLIRDMIWLRNPDNQHAIIKSIEALKYAYTEELGVFHESKQSNTETLVWLGMKQQLMNN